MQSGTCGLKFCSAWVRVACVILAHAASHVTFHGYFQSTSTKQLDQSFLELKIHLPVNRFVFMIFTPCCKYTMLLNGYF